MVHNSSDGRAAVIGVLYRFGLPERFQLQVSQSILCLALPILHLQILLALVVLCSNIIEFAPCTKQLQIPVALLATTHVKQVNVPIADPRTI